MNIQPEIIHNIKNISSVIKNSDYPLTKLPLEMFEGIQHDIPLFHTAKPFQLDNIAFITKYLETLNIFRGCNVGCTHCLKNATTLSEGQRTILFEDLIRFLSGFKTLSERFGFNVLQGNKYLNIIDDSNPSDIPINSISGEKHSIVEAIRNIYESLRIPTLFVTSGWNKSSKYAQTSSEELAKMVEHNPQTVHEIEISINPFSSLMEKSRQGLKENNREKADFFRNIYTSRMANVLATFMRLFEINKARIIYRHADNYEGNELVGENETKKLYQEIFTKFKQIIGTKADEIPSIQPEIVTEFNRSHLIEPSGRARRYFPQKMNFKEQSELIDEALFWTNMSEKEKRQFLYDYSVKCIDIDGHVYTTIPAQRVECVNMPIELTIPTDIRLNYENKNTPPPIFSDIEL